jgi:hypothetical protein
LERSIAQPRKPVDGHGGVPAVWHRDEDMPIVNAYVEAFSKVTERHHELQG